MTNPNTESGPTPLELLTRQQETIEALTATVERHQRQIEALWRRIQDLEGLPLPDHEPPS
ncbi:MAG: hypothetical protein JO345_33015 [Streptosporangiaceae bacterium]|nr:hypothetical protein [Streptosporangiaceae bacterium]